MLNLITIFLVLVTAAAAETVSCKFFPNLYGNEDKSRCDLSDVEAITSLDVEISDLKTDQVKTVLLSHNEKVKFLPVSLYKTFPKLQVIGADCCSIRNITKRNFQHLRWLQQVYLGNNLIETILSDTFDGLVRLREVYLNGNKIKFMNAQLWEQLPSLKHVSLICNACINSFFGLLIPITSLSRIVSESCSFGDPDFRRDELRCEPNYSGSCKLVAQTVITFDNLTFSVFNKNEILSLTLEPNKNVKYLPILVHEAFPNLYHYIASSCAIQEISMKNFEKLFELTIIDLNDNKISTITYDTFRGLPRLAHINLARNNIRFMNGRWFEKLPLSALLLQGNNCTDESFIFKQSSDNDDGAELSNFSKKVAKSCGFEDDEGDCPDFETTFNLKCGLVKVPQAFIAGGTETGAGQWPFLVALLAAQERTFFCGGNLITNKHVLTAAHCVHAKQRNPTQPNQFFVLLGTHSLKNSGQPSATRSVSEIRIHGDWNSTDQKYDADIAILFLNQSVEFTEFIQPVCITTNEELFTKQNENGTLVGWGITESRNSPVDISRQVRITAVNDSTCLAKSGSQLGRIFEKRAFCAGGEKVPGACSGDSGGGLFVEFQGFWTLKGIVSSGSYGNDSCGSGAYSLYTKVQSFSVWISETIGRISEEPCKKNATT